MSDPSAPRRTYMPGMPGFMPDLSKLLPAGAQRRIHRFLAHAGWRSAGLGVVCLAVFALWIWGLRPFSASLDNWRRAELMRNAQLVAGALAESAIDQEAAISSFVPPGARRPARRRPARGRAGVFIAARASAILRRGQENAGARFLLYDGNARLILDSEQIAAAGSVAVAPLPPPGARAVRQRDSRSQALRKKAALARPRINEALKGAGGSEIRQGLFIAAAPVQKLKIVRGVVVAIQERELAREAGRAQRWINLWVFLGGAGLVAGFWLMVWTGFLGPVRRLLRAHGASGAAAAGDIDRIGQIMAAQARRARRAGQGVRDLAQGLSALAGEADVSLEPGLRGRNRQAAVRAVWCAVAELEESLARDDKKGRCDLRALLRECALSRNDESRTRIALEEGRLGARKGMVIRIEVEPLARVLVCLLDLALAASPEKEGKVRLRLARAGQDAAGNVRVVISDQGRSLPGGGGGLADWAARCARAEALGPLVAALERAAAALGGRIEAGGLKSGGAQAALILPDRGESGLE